MATIQEIADLAGVSRGTVDRVINHRGKVKADIEEKILNIIEETKYVHKQRRKTYVIGVVTQLSTASFMQEIEKGILQIEQEVEERGITLKKLHSKTVDEKEQLRLIEQLESEGIDALALMPVDHEVIMKKINELVDKGIPVVTFNSDIAGTKRTCFVGMDNRKSGKVAAGLMKLMMRERGKVLVITGYFTNRANSMRVESFIGEINTCPNIQVLGVQSSYDKAEGVEDIVRNTLKDHDDLEGIFLASAGQEGVFQALKKSSLKKRPHVIAYDVTKNNLQRLKRGDFDFLIDQESHLQGYQAIKVLYELLHKKQQPISQELFTQIQLKTKDSI